jgi:hypothetical protein
MGPAFNRSTRLKVEFRMPLRSFLLRFSGLVALTVWVGGFTFYSALVIPILHDQLGSLDAGFVTQKVTDSLNAVGMATVAVWWAIVGWERRVGSGPARRARIALLATTTSLLLVLVLLHRVLDDRLEGSRMRGFYELHRLYLIASTVQWVANLGLLGVSLILWRDRPRESAGRDTRDRAG